MAGKCGNLRRLSLILLAAERNHYLGLLPAIQERLVEMLRSGNVSTRVHSEVRQKILLMTLEAVNLYSRVLGISVSKGVNVQNQPATSYQLLARDIG